MSEIEIKPSDLGTIMDMVQSATPTKDRIWIPLGLTYKEWYARAERVGGAAGAEYGLADLGAAGVWTFGLLGAIRIGVRREDGEIHRDGVFNDNIPQDVTIVAYSDPPNHERDADHVLVAYLCLGCEHWHRSFVSWFGCEKSCGCEP